MNRTDVPATLREMWETRPARPREGQQVAGVAAAVARRYDIDPVLVRVGFVVSAFYGIGAALYIAGWILLPAEADDGGGQRPSRRRPLLMIGLGIATVVSLGSLFGGHVEVRNGGILVPAAVAAGLLFLLHRSRSDRGVVGSGTSGGAAAAPSTARPAEPGGAAAGSPSGVAGSATDDPPVTPVKPPAWDPLGAAPFAWDLPEPAPVPVPAAPRRRRSPVTAVTLAAALLAGGVTGLVLLVGGSLSALPVLFGVVLAVLGTGLVIGAFTRSGRGLIPVALVLSALTWAVVAAPLDRWQGGFGELRVTPLTADAVAPSYQQSFGSVDLDLRAVDLSVPAGQPATPVQIALSVGAGEVTVWVPRNADLTVNADAEVGDVRVEDQERSGRRASLAVTDDPGADGIRSGRPVELVIKAGVGSVEVRRG